MDDLPVSLIPATRTQLWLRDRLVGTLGHLGPLAARLGGRATRTARSLTLRNYSPLPTRR